MRVLFALSLWRVTVGWELPRQDPLLRVVFDYYWERLRIYRSSSSVEVYVGHS